MKIVVLAKSYREGGYCLAGKDIETKKWIRPVTKTGPISKEILRNINLLDIVDIEIIKHCPDAHQQENYYFIEESFYKCGCVDKNYINLYLDYPKNIWDVQGSIGKDRLYPAEIAKYGIKNSLLLIKPLTPKINFNNYKKICCSFEYNGTVYNLRVTDIIATHNLKEGDSLEDSYFCISLAHEFLNKYTNKIECYKLIAGII